MQSQVKCQLPFPRTGQKEIASGCAVLSQGFFKEKAQVLAKKENANEWNIPQLGAASKAENWLSGMMWI